MKGFSLAILTVALSLNVLAVPHPSKKNSLGDGLLVKTTSGNVQGFFNHTAPDVRQFLGVPFAEPPVGDLRFAKPQIKKPNGTVHALTLPNSCMQQFDSNSSTIYTEYETGFLISG